MLPYNKKKTAVSSLFFIFFFEIIIVTFKKIVSNHIFPYLLVIIYNMYMMVMQNCISFTIQLKPNYTVF